MGVGADSTQKAFASGDVKALMQRDAVSLAIGGYGGYDPGSDVHILIAVCSRWLAIWL